MLPEEFVEPYIDDDQILEIESYMDDLVAHMLTETENGQEPVEFYRCRMVDAVASVADLVDLIPQLTYRETKAEEKRMSKILLSMCDILDFTLLMAHAFETGLPDAEIINGECGRAIIDVQTNSTICAMSLLSPINTLSYTFFLKRNADDFEADDSDCDILDLLAGLSQLCEHLQINLFDVMYARAV